MLARRYFPVNRPQSAWRIIAVFTAAWLVWNAGMAWAVEPPLSQQELERRSDLVAEVRVLDVVCTGHKYEKRRERRAKYHARLQILEVKKGKAAVGETVIVHWTEGPLKSGEWSVGYYPGEEALTHLVWSPEDRAYSTTSWNAKYELKPAKSTELPKKCP